MNIIWTDKTPNEIIVDINQALDLMAPISGPDEITMPSPVYLAMYLDNRPHIAKLWSAGWRAGFIVNGFRPH